MSVVQIKGHQLVTTGKVDPLPIDRRETDWPLGDFAAPAKGSVSKSEHRDPPFFERNRDVLTKDGRGLRRTAEQGAP